MLGWGIAAVIVFLIAAFLFPSFMLSSRISREEEAEEYRLLCLRLQKLTDQRAANDTAHEEPPISVVRS